MRNVRVIRFLLIWNKIGIDAARGKRSYSVKIASLLDNKIEILTDRRKI
jgi:hypothetical protein